MTGGKIAIFWKAAWHVPAAERPPHAVAARRLNISAVTMRGRRDEMREVRMRGHDAGRERILGRFRLALTLTFLKKNG
jgi:hypothetical protein